MKLFNKIKVAFIAFVFCLGLWGCSYHKVDFNDYLNKVWTITDSKTDQVLFFFYITDIEKDRVEGKCNFSWLEAERDIGELDFEGSIVKNELHCTFSCQYEDSAAQLMAWKDDVIGEFVFTVDEFGGISVAVKAKREKYEKKAGLDEITTTDVYRYKAADDSVEDEEYLLNGYSLHTDYNQYINKIWIMRPEESDSPYYFTFRIREMDGEKIRGDFYTDTEKTTTEGYYDQCYPVKSMSSFSGVVQDGRAECDFQDVYGNKGRMQISFLEGNNALVILTFDQKTIAYRTETNKTYLYKICDMDDMKDFHAEEFLEINVPALCDESLRLYGGMKQSKDQGGYPTAYLAMADGKVLYQFDMGGLIGTRLSELVVNDVDKDGMEDVKMTLCIPYDNGEKLVETDLEWQFCQTPDGSFSIVEKEQDISDILYKTWEIREQDNGDDTLGTRLSFTVWKEKNGGFCGLYYDRGTVDRANHQGRGCESVNFVNGILFCELIQESSCDERNLAILSLEEDGVLVNLNIEKIQENVPFLSSGNHLSTAYNLSDLRDVEVIDEFSFDLNLESLGDVKLVSLRAVDELSGIYIFITDFDGNILTSAPLGRYGITVSNIEIKDMNGDGLKDIVVTREYDYQKMYSRLISYQTEDGSFFSSPELDPDTNLPFGYGIEGQG